ncbi:uncharacterized protein CTRU02_205330 [Colletotrichum truncatum]|uniref:Uncharacterized protein n=1 Tax=Colletotrichum truncatum TaxID=5467 RepID=A0ACC3Z3U6_COLTU
MAVRRAADTCSRRVTRRFRSGKPPPTNKCAIARRRGEMELWRRNSSEQHAGAED